MALADQLVPYFSFDEESGSRVDSHGDNDLTEFNTVGFAAGKQSNAASLISANNEYLSKTTPVGLSPGNGDLTIALWVWLDSTASGQYIISRSSGGTFGAYEWLLRVEAGRIQFLVQDGVSTAANVRTAGVTTGQWYFVVAWHDSVNNQIGIRLNGAIDPSFGLASYSAGLPVLSVPLNVGSLSGSSGTFNGRVDECGIWVGRVLSTAEQSDLYNSGNGRDYAYINLQPPVNQALPTLTINSDGTWSGTVGTWSNEPTSYAWELRGVADDSVVDSGTGTTFSGSGLAIASYYLWVEATNDAGTGEAESATAHLVVRGPFCSAAKQAYVPGSVARQAFCPGSVAKDCHAAGSQASQGVCCV